MMSENTDFGQSDPLLDALDYLSWDEQKETLAIRRKNVTEGNYFIAFVGQFSAGKSYLINNIIGRTLLPSSSTETTPLLTYVRYGNPEQAVLHFPDGSVREIPVEEVLQVRQNNSTLSWDSVEYLEVLLDSEILKHGMILLDTPGINTMIDRHEMLLANSLNLASRIIYVAGHAVTQVDSEKLKMLCGLGFAPCFVRTHFDEIRPTEESPTDAMNADLGILEDCGISAADCYFVSNHSDSEWYYQIDPLRDMLKTLGKNAGEELMAAASDYEQHLAAQCAKELTKRKESLKSVKDGDDKLIAHQLDAIQKKIDNFEKTVMRRQDHLQKEIEACQNNLSGPIREQLAMLLDNSVQAISSSEAESPAQMAQVMHSEALKLGTRANAAIRNAVTPLLQSIQSTQTDSGFELDLSGVPEYVSFTELAEAQDSELQYLMTRLSDIQTNRANLENRLMQMSNSPEYLEMQRELSSLETAIVECRQEMQGLPPYVPQYVEVVDNRPQPSDVARAIGGAVDWILLFLPGDVLSKGVKALSGSEKVLKSGAKFLGTLEKTLPAADKAKDLLFTARGIKNKLEELKESKRGVYATKRRKETVQNALITAGDAIEAVEIGVANAKQQPGILDYLTVQYWAEKAGQHFDRPPKFELDQEYEAAYRAERNRIASQMVETQLRKFEKRRQLGVYETEEAQLKARREASVVDQRELEAELNQRKHELYKQAEEKADKSWKEKCGAWFHAQVQPNLDAMLADQINALPERMQLYHDSVMDRAQENLEVQRSEYARLAALPKGEAEQDLEHVIYLIGQLHRVYPEVVVG